MATPRSDAERLSCLRCADTALTELHADDKIRFLACPSCHRQFALSRGGKLTYRWGHPISLALYAVQFEAEPMDGLERTAELMRDQAPADRRAEMIEEIELELREPTQAVRDMLPRFRFSEEATREFLAALVVRLKAGL